ncbi:hypothetical protein [Pseudorhodoferax sp.]|uniref:hypothetical protein n=1 Tax=Pseudorhodoferax sp. TaxID=1993553 RepID=UPI0039E4A064
MYAADREGDIGARMHRADDLEPPADRLTRCRNDGAPGIKTMWIGLQRVADLPAGMHRARHAGLL